MKSFIVAVIMIPLVLYVPLQSMLDRVNHYRISTTNAIVHKHAERARIEGYFTHSNTQEMLASLSEYLKIDSDEIQHDLTTEPRYRLLEFEGDSEMIDFRIEIPIGRVIAMPRFWGGTIKDHSASYVIEGAVASELLPQ